jgi:uncharacterized protein YacL
MLSSKMSDKHNNLKKKLNEEEEKYYDEVVKERMFIYLIGLCVGIVVAFLATNSLLFKSKVNKVCLFVVIALVVNVVVYMVYPKEKWLLNKIGSDQTKVNAWLDVYKEMKLKKFIGMGLGLIAYYLLGDGLLE